MDVVVLGSGAVHSFSSYPDMSEATKMFPKVPMVPREPDGPPAAKKPRATKPAPYDDPECKRAYGEFGWHFCESIVFEWKVEATKDLLDEDRWKQAKQYCRNQAE